MAGDFGLFIDVDSGLIVPKFENGDFVADETLETAIILSWFSDQRVEVADLPAGETKQRGFWADEYADVEGDKYGSKLWTLNRSKISNENIPLIETRAAEALTWLVDDGAAKSVAVTAELINNRLKLAATIEKPDGTKNRYGFIWDEQKLRRA